MKCKSTLFWLLFQWNLSPLFASKDIPLLPKPINTSESWLAMSEDAIILLAAVILSTNKSPLALMSPLAVMFPWNLPLPV